jgi:hypothetical protein
VHVRNDATVGLKKAEDRSTFFVQGDRESLTQLETRSGFLQANGAEPMEPVRCPYCVEGNAFKVMQQVEHYLACSKCGHKVVPDRPTFICSCPNCRYLNQPRQKPN